MAFLATEHPASTTKAHRSGRSFSPASLLEEGVFHIACPHGKYCQPDGDDDRRAGEIDSRPINYLGHLRKARAINVLADLITPATRPLKSSC